MTILIVGGGKMGMSHLAIASQIAGKKGVALCETKWPSRFLFSKFGFEVFSSIEAAERALDQISGIIVATPTQSHFPIARFALERAIPCFIEKPMTLDVDRSRQLARLAREKGVFGQMGFVLRYVSAFFRLRTLVKEGMLGEAASYSARMAGNVITKAETKSWRTDFTLGGGCLNEYGPHLLDLCRFIFGDVRELGQVTKRHVHSSKADDKIDLDWLHNSGVPGQLALDWCDTSKRKSVIQFDIRFKYARVTADNSTLQIIFDDSSPLSAEDKTALSQVHVPPKVSFYLRGEEFTLQLEEFIGQCHSQRLHVGSIPPGITSTLEDGVEVDRLIDEIARRSGLK